MKLYISAIKGIIKHHYQWNENFLLLETLTKACKLQNDTLKTRLPISGKLLELILFEAEHYFAAQSYLNCMYKALFAIGYYGLLRIGKMVLGSQGDQHTLLAKNIHIVTNKEILLLLYSSKTHDQSMKPQKVKITSTTKYPNSKKIFCPFIILREFLIARGGFLHDDEKCFIFRDGTVPSHNQVRKILRVLIQRINLEPSLYDTHSLRGGRALDMLKSGFTIEQIKCAGRWKSNAVYKYLK